ncbi:MAG: helix-turn-helix domain-containing protein [Bryobacteraceae bacterium]|nr:helix-turn-helix domain-containing protein [Bryobacteraceae bacterium]
MGTYELAILGLAGSGFGTAVSVPMFWPRSRPRDVRLLGGAIFLMSLIAALISGRLAGLVPSAPFIEHTVNLLGFFALPLAVFHTRAGTGAQDVFGKAAWLWTPAAAYVTAIAARSALGLDSRLPFVFLIPILLGFTALCAVTVWTPGAARRATVIRPDYIVVFLIVLNLAQILRTVLGHIPLVRVVVPLTACAGFLAMVIFAAWRGMGGTPPEPSASASPRYQRSTLNDAHAAELLARIEHAMTHDRIFTRPDLTLAQLAAAVESTPHQVSQVLNCLGRASFSDLVNRRRVEDVKARLLHPASARLTIEGIGAAAGFGSRTAMYAAFQRFEGKTPSAFRLQGKDEGGAPAARRGEA